MIKHLKFNINELAGCFGDIGTSLPLIIGMTLVAKLDPASIFIMFGAMQIAMGIYYGLPMPIQPLKAMAAMVIALKISGDVLFGAGLAIGFSMLILTVTGALDWIARVIPHCVIRGVQVGLGASLAFLALKNYIFTQGEIGIALALVGFVIVIVCARQSRVPGGLLLVGVGVIFALFFKLKLGVIVSGIGFALPKIHIPSLSNIATGFFVLALPQLPLSISNSIVATQKAVNDFFPNQNEPKVTVKKIGFTYSLLNLLAPLMSGIPVCHGCGGIAGYYAFGARTGGSTVIIGTMYILIGLVFSQVFSYVVEVFPLPILGVTLFFEAIALMRLAKDIAKTPYFSVTLLVALIAFTCPQGYLLGILAGMVLYYCLQRFLVKDLLVKWY